MQSPRLATVETLSQVAFNSSKVGGGAGKYRIAGPLVGSDAAFYGLFGFVAGFLFGAKAALGIAAQVFLV